MIIHRCSHEVPVIKGVYCDVSRLIISDTSPNVLDNAQTKSTVSALMKFLRRRGASEGRLQRAKPQGDFLSSSGSTEGAGAAQNHEHPQSGASSESEAMDLSDDAVCQTACVDLLESAIDPTEYHSPFDEEPPSRQMFSDSHIDLKQRIQQPIQSYPQHSPHVPLAEPSWQEAHRQWPLPPAAQQPPHSFQLSDVSNVSILTSQQAGVPHHRPSPQPTDTPQPNHWPQHKVCHTADTTESVDRDSVLSAAASQGQRRPKKAASWSKGRKHRPSVQQMQFEAKGTGDWTSAPGGSVKSYQITTTLSSIAVNQHLSKEV